MFLSLIHLRIIMAVVTAHEVESSVWPLGTRWHKMDQVTISHRRRDWNVVPPAFLSSHGLFCSTQVSSWKPRNTPTQIQFQMEYPFFFSVRRKAKQCWLSVGVKLSCWCVIHSSLLGLRLTAPYCRWIQLASYLWGEQANHCCRVWYEIVSVVLESPL